MNALQEYFIDVLRYKYVDFNGRARRSEYWFFLLFSIFGAFIILRGSLIFGNILDCGNAIGLGLVILYMMVLFIPFLALRTRRLHDTNKSGWFQLFYFLPFGGIVLFIFMVLDSDHGSNKYGPNPKLLNRPETADHLLDYN